MATKLAGDVDSYSFQDCKQIGKNLLDELRQSIKSDHLPDVEDPKVKATNYLAETEILQLLEVSFDLFLTGLVLNYLGDVCRIALHQLNVL